MRHQKLVERKTTVAKYEILPEGSHEYPVKITYRNEENGRAERIVHAKFLIGCDGAKSTIRKQMDVPFDGVSTDLCWGIIDCVFESDYPHAWVFGYVVKTFICS